MRGRLATTVAWSTDDRVQIFSGRGPRFLDIVSVNKTRQGYARKRTLKLAGSFLPGIVL